MTRNFKHLQREAKVWQTDDVALAHAVGDRFDAFVERGVDVHRVVLNQRADAADMVGMVVRCENRREDEMLTGKVSDYRFGISGIYHDGVRALAQAPDVVVLEGGNRRYLDAFAHAVRS
jgi:hypothetical protein